MKPEAAFQQQVFDLAHLRGWVVAHFRSVYDGNAKRWMTPVGADGKGFPDLVLTRERVIFAELKSKTGGLRPEQKDWLDLLRLTGAEVYVWRPQHLEDISDTLMRRQPTPQEGT